MGTRPPDSAPGRTRRSNEDFEWPPTGDDPGVYVVSLDAADEDERAPGVWRRRAALAADPDPWRGLQEAATEAFAQRHGTARAAAAPCAVPAAAGHEPLRRLGLLLAGAALVVIAASWTLYRVTSPPTAPTLTRVATIVPAAARQTTAPAPRVVDTIFATYPVEDRRAANDRVDADAVHPVTTRAIATSEPTPDPPLAARGPEPVLVDASMPLPDAPIPAADAGPSLSPVASALSPVAASAAVSDTGPGRDERIRRVLEQYEAAYDRRDVRTAAALVPSHDVRALSKAFDGLDRQDVNFDRCDIDAGDERGSAVCVGTVRYVPRVGRSVEREGRITWTFHLTRLGDDWRIDRFSAR